VVASQFQQKLSGDEAEWPIFLFSLLDSGSEGCLLASIRFTTFWVHSEMCVLLFDI